MRTGRDYLEALRDTRFVFVDGHRVDDVTAHPAFAPAASAVAELYDVAADGASGMQYEAEAIGGTANRTYMIPRNREDLAARRQSISRWARVSSGFLGRSPDHVAGFLAGFASAPHLFNRDNRELGENVSRFYLKSLRESLFGSYVIIPPQVDRSLVDAGAHGAFYQVGVKDERDGDIVLHGAQMLGTSSAISDYVYVSCIRPLQAHEDKYAIACVVPMSTKGLKVYCRRPYAVGQPSSYDYPLSTRFDETDALLVFDHVTVPWEDVFVYRDVEMTRNQFFMTAAHALGNTQAQIRLVTKVQFLLGLARKIAEVNGVDRHPEVQGRLGELAALGATVEAMVMAAEYECVVDEHGVAVPNRKYLYGAMGLQAELYPRVLSALREISGAGMIQVPSSYRDLDDPVAYRDLTASISADPIAAEERIKVFKLAWDVVGSEFGSRHHQYEMFYAGAPFVAKGYAFRNYPYAEAAARVDEFLDKVHRPHGQKSKV